MKKLILSLILLTSGINFAQNPNGWIQESAQFYHDLSGLTSNGYVR